VRKVKSCVVCGAMTTNLLFNDKILGIAACSSVCENEYLNHLAPNMREQINRLRDLDYKIEETKRHEKTFWLIAGFGLLIFAIGFLIQNVAMVLLGIFPITLGALSTRHFEEEKNKLMKLRKRILF